VEYLQRAKTGSRRRRIESTQTVPSVSDDRRYCRFEVGASRVAFCRTVETEFQLQRFGTIPQPDARTWTYKLPPSGNISRNANSTATTRHHHYHQQRDTQSITSSGVELSGRATRIKPFMDLVTTRRRVNKWDAMKITT
jgi:hypothetical protein